MNQVRVSMKDAYKDWLKVVGNVSGDDTNVKKPVAVLPSLKGYANKNNEDARKLKITESGERDSKTLYTELWIG